MTTRLRARIAVTAAAAVVASMLAYASSGSASAATALPGPVLVGPLSSVEQLKSVTLSWLPVSGATSYKVEVGTDDSWSDTPTYAAVAAFPRLTLPSWLPHAAYVWRVAAVSASGQGRWSAASPLGTFARGWRTAPSSLKVTFDPHGDPSFTWAPIPTASAYEVQFSSSPTFNDGVGQQTQGSPDVASCFTHRTRLAPFMDQASRPSATAGPCDVHIAMAYWRVRGIDQLDTAAQEVDTTPAVDEGISHLPPTDKPNTADFTDCPGTPPSPVPPVGTSPAPSPSASASPAASASASPAASASASPAAAGECKPTGSVEKGPWSGSLPIAWPAVPAPVYGDYRTLPAVQTLPLTADLANGCSGTTEVTCTDFPTIRWNPSVDGAGATAPRYRVYIALDSTYSNIQRVVETSALEWTPSDSWRDSSATQSYYYAVQPCTAVGCGAVTSDPPSFKKRSPSVAAIGQQMVSGASVLSWHDYASTLADTATSRNGGTRVAAPSEAAAYHVQVAKDDNPDFLAGSSLVDDSIVDGAVTAASDVVSYVSSKNYGDGTFLWRVQAVDAGGHKLPWNTVGSFVRDATPPTAAASPVSNVSVTPLIRVAFSEPVTGVSASTLTLPGVNANVVSLDDMHATIKPTTPLVPGASYQLTLGSGIKDLSGNSAVSAGPVLTVNPLADDRSAAVSYAGVWRSMASSNAIGGTFHAAAPAAGHPVNSAFSAFGSGVLVTGCMGPSGGNMAVYVDGVLKSTRDTYRSFSGCNINLVRVTGLKKGSHKVQVRATATKRAASKGTAVALDAVTALP